MIGTLSFYFARVNRGLNGYYKCFTGGGYFTYSAWIGIIYTGHHLALDG